LAKQLHRVVALTQEVAVGRVVLALAHLLILVRAGTLEAEALHIRLLLRQTEVTQGATGFESLCVSGQPLLATELTGLLCQPLCVEVAGLVSQCCLKTRLGPKLLALHGSLQVLLPDAEASGTVTLELRLRVFIGRLQTTGLDVAHLLTQSPLTFSGSQKLPSSAISALTCSTEVLGQLAFLRVAHRFALLHIHDILDVRRHILLGLLVTELLRALHPVPF
jgi:hypothetical protein